MANSQPEQLAIRPRKAFVPLSYPNPADVSNGKANGSSGSGSGSGSGSSGAAARSAASSSSSAAASIAAVSNRALTSSSSVKPKATPGKVPTVKPEPVETPHLMIDDASSIVNAFAIKPRRQKKDTAVATLPNSTTKPELNGSASATTASVSAQEAPQPQYPQFTAPMTVLTASEITARLKPSDAKETTTTNAKEGDASKQPATPLTPITSSRLAVLEITEALRRSHLVERAFKNGVITTGATGTKTLFDDLFQTVCEHSPVVKQINTGKAPDQKQFSSLLTEGLSPNEALSKMPDWSFDLESRMLFEGGVQRVSPRNPKLIITSPACSKEQQCVAVQFPFEWADLEHEDKKGKPFPVMASMTKEELIEHETSGAVPLVRRVCRICERRKLGNDVNRLMTFRVNLPRSLPLQQWYNLHDCADGYDSKFMVHPIAKPFNGLIFPVVGVQLDKYKRMYSQQYQCRYISQEELRWVNAHTKQELAGAAATQRIF